MYRFLTAAGLLLLSMSLTAQDPAFSQFFANRIYLNPAFAGLESGLQFTASSRNQWYGADHGYTLHAAAAEWQEPCWNSGFGLSLRYAQEGLAPLSTSGAAFTYAFMPRIKNGNLHLGLQYSYNQKRLNIDKLVFSDQLDPVYGNIYPTLAQSPISEQVQFNDFAFGAVWRWDSRIRMHGKSMSNLRSHIGLAIHHLASLVGEGPDESFLRTGAEVPARLTLHGGMIIPFTFLQGVGNHLILSPNIRLESQGATPLNFGKSLTLFTGGIYVVFLNRFTTGIFYQSRSPLPESKNTNSLLLSAGFSSRAQDSKGDNFYIGISVDVNASGLGWRSNNIYEFNARYALRGLRTFCDKGKGAFKPGHGPLPCPNFAY